MHVRPLIVALTSLVALTACAESEPVPPSRPRHGRTRVEAVDPTAGALASMQASEERRAAERQATADATGEIVAKVETAEADKRAARRAAEAKACADSRERRVSHAKEMIIARMDAETRLYTHAKAIRAACKLTERATGAVNVQHSGSGFRVSPELADDVKCGPAGPKGITKDDAWVILAREREGITKPTGPILDADDASPEDGRCALHDQAAGLNFAAATFENPMGITWTPPEK